MDEFNNKDFLKYITKTNIPSSEVNYLIKLYKNYKSLYDYTKGDIINNQNKINALEDKIYTTNNQVLTEFDRIKLEIIKIKEKYQNCSSSKKALAYNYIIQIYNLINDKNFLNNPESILYVKKIIITIQLILDINITFLYTAYLFFIEKYRNLSLTYNEKIDYIPINKNINIGIKKKGKKNDKFK